MRPASASGDAGVTLVSNRDGKKTFRVNRTTFEVDAQYHIHRVLGHGSYGVVCAASDTQTNSQVAIKKIERLFDDLIDARRIIRELIVLRLIRDNGARNVLHIHKLMAPSEPVHSFKDVYVVSGLFSRDLYSTSRDNPLTIAALKKVASDVLIGLYDIHTMGVIHRDIKPHNILLEGGGSGPHARPIENATICDFGLARFGFHKFTEPRCFTDRVVTRYYRSPELLLMNKYHYPVDLWSLGCVLYEAFAGETPFPGVDYLDQIVRVVSLVPINLSRLDFLTLPSARHHVENIKAKPNGWPDISSRLKSHGLEPNGVDLIMRLLDFNPDDRITAEAAMNHPFVREFTSRAAPRSPHFNPNPVADASFDVSSHNVSEKRFRKIVYDECRRLPIGYEASPHSHTPAMTPPAGNSGGGGGGGGGSNGVLVAAPAGARQTQPNSPAGFK